MKVLGLILLLAVALGDETHFFHQDGKMFVNNEEGKMFGVVIVELLKSANFTHIAGMHVKNGVHTPFYVTSKITAFTKNADGSFVINATAYEAMYGQKAVKNIIGAALVKGTWDKAQYIGKYLSTGSKLVFEFDTTGKGHPCQYYSMEEASKRAGYLVGESHANYKGNHLLNHAVFGFAYLDMTCKDYLKEVGTPIKKEKAGAIIIGNDGDYCAIVDHEGNKFIHSDPIKKKIIMSPMSMIGTYFKKGHTIKEYKCATNY